jgi:hypothetical protein
MIEQPWLNMQVTLEGDRMYVKLMNGKANEVVPIFPLVNYSVMV